MMPAPPFPTYSSGAVGTAQRFRPGQECPVCGGHSNLPAHRGTRCYGFLSGDGRYAHCSREEHAGTLQSGSSGLYAHRLGPACRCGRPHHGGPTLEPWRTAKPAKPANADRTEAALRVWRAALPTSGTPAAHYLHGRGITPPLPAALRYAPRLLHAPTRQELPALVAAVTIWPARTPVAVHRTYLRRDGNGKAPVEPCKMALGPTGGGAVQLAPPGERLALAEGIETALSVQQATELPTWAVLGGANLAAVVLPALPLAAEVIVAADGDAAGQRYAYTAAERWARQGRRVRVAVPPAGADFNDLLLARGDA